MKTVQIYDISWVVDEYQIEGVRSHTGEKYGHLLSDAEDEQEGLPSEMILEVEEGADLDDLYWLIEREAGAFYCVCGGYEVEDDNE